MFDKILLDHANQVRNDGKLHFSSHLQHARHAVLAHEIGYPETRKEWGSVAQLVSGTAMHEELHRIMGAALAPEYHSEITVPPININGIEWTGTADAVTVLDGQRWLIDYKNTSSMTFDYLNGKPKDDHILQVSAYYYFLPEELIQPGTKCGVLYIPSSANFSRKWADPTFLEFEPVPYDDVVGVMQTTGDAIHQYRKDGTLPAAPTGEWSWKMNKRKNVQELLYKPHWASRYCPWSSLFDDPCECSTEGIVFGGTYDPVTDQYDLTDEAKRLPETITKAFAIPVEV
jgi:hypothetical protein